MNKPRLSIWQIWNMSFGFLGIQFGWGLQSANLSPIYAKLGSNPDEIPLLDDQQAWSGSDILERIATGQLMLNRRAVPKTEL